MPTHPSLALPHVLFVRRAARLRRVGRGLGGQHQPPPPFRRASAEREREREREREHVHRSRGDRICVRDAAETHRAELQRRDGERGARSWRGLARRNALSGSATEPHEREHGRGVPRKTTLEKRLVVSDLGCPASTPRSIHPAISAPTEPLQVNLNFVAIISKSKTRGEPRAHTPPQPPPRGLFPFRATRRHRQGPGRRCVAQPPCASPLDCRWRPSVAPPGQHACPASA